MVMSEFRALPQNRRSTEKISEFLASVALLKTMKPFGSEGLFLIRSRSRKLDKKINVNGYTWLFYTFSLTAIKLIDGFNPVADVQFFIHMVNMFTYRFLADKQGRGNFFVHQSARKQLEDLLLPV